MSEYQTQASVSVAMSEDGDELMILNEEQSEVSVSSATPPNLADLPPFDSAISQLEREIAFIDEKLTRGQFNPQSGAHIPYVDSPAEREKLSQQRDFLAMTLRDQKALQQQRDAAITQRKTEAGARQATVEARALEMLEAEGIDADARALADAIKASQRG